ncbi:MAG: hypothetical protein ABI871_00800 [Chthoniobacterales bacterium]
MNPRERLLALLVAGTVFALFNLFLWSWLLGSLRKAHAQLATRKTARTEQVVYMREDALWRKRDQWLKDHQPRLKGPADASTLLDQVKEIAGKHKVLIENPAIGTGDTTPIQQSVFASIETKSAWPPLVHFLYDVQKPESFIVFESVNLAVDGTDPTTMRGKFKLARWFAPAGAK